MRKFVLGVVSFLLVMVLCSCSGLNKTPDENQILSDYLVKSPEPEYANFNAVEIKRSQLNKDEKSFVADIELVGKDEYADYLCSSSIQYNYYDDQGWMLDKITNRELKTVCHTGRLLDDIKNDILTNYTTFFPGGVWVDNIEVEDVLEQNMQLVTLDCETEINNLITTYNDVKMYFKYGNGNWFVDNIEKNVSNFKINLQGTSWEETSSTVFLREPIRFKIKKISDDSKTIIVEHNGVDYTGTLNSPYTETYFCSETLLGAEYVLNKEFPEGVEALQITGAITNNPYIIEDHPTWNHYYQAKKFRMV